MKRPWWSRYFIALLLLFWFSFTILFSFNVLVFGEQVAANIVNTFKLEIPLETIVAYSKYPIIIVALVALALTLYLLTPEIYQTVRQALPGRRLLRPGLAGFDVSIPRLRRAVRALWRELPQLLEPRRPAHVDLRDLAPPLAWRAIKHHHPPGMARRKHAGVRRNHHRFARLVIRRPYLIAGLFVSVLGVRTAGSDPLGAAPAAGD